jgi:hypothetical protein
MDKLQGKVVPQLIGQWLFVLGNACKNARLNRMRSWEEIVGAYHARIAKLIMSDAYAEFTHTQKEDMMYLEGLALWAGHDYSSTKGRDISHWADEYRRLVMRKLCETRNYLHWSTSMNRVLKGERSLRQLAEIVVYSMKCMGQGKALFVPPRMEERIRRAGGVNGLIICQEHAKTLERREFTIFLATAIECRRNPWPSQEAVEDGTAPSQILQDFKNRQNQKALRSPTPGKSPPMSPRVKQEAKTEKDKGSFKEVLKRDVGQLPITKFMNLRERAREVEEDVRGLEERLERIDPVIQDVKQEVAQGASGRCVRKHGAEDVEMDEGTKTDEEPLIRRPRAKRKTEAVEEKSLKRRETETEEEAPTASKTKKTKKEKKKAIEQETMGAAEKRRSRQLLAEHRPATTPRASRSRSVDVLRKMAREEESVKRRRLARSERFVAYIREYPEQFPVVKWTRKGKAMPVGEKQVERFYEEGCKVVVVPDPGEPRAKYGFLIFLELDLVVGFELGPLPHNTCMGASSLCRAVSRASSALVKGMRELRSRKWRSSLRRWRIWR